MNTGKRDASQLEVNEFSWKDSADGKDLQHNQQVEIEIEGLYALPARQTSPDLLEVEILPLPQNQRHCYQQISQYQTPYRTVNEASILRIGHQSNIPEEIVQTKPLYKCNMCNYITMKYGELESHSDSVHGTSKKPFKCNKCDYSSKNQYAIKRHNRIVHEKHKPFECHLCDYKASQKSNLLKHLPVHYKKKRHICIKCSYECSSVQEIIAHSKTHEQCT